MLDKLSYDTLVFWRDLFGAAILIAMFLSTLRENRPWVSLLYVVFGFLVIIFSISMISKETSINLKYRTSKEIGTLATLCTTIWAYVYGRKFKIFGSEKKEWEEGESY